MELFVIRHKATGKIMPEYKNGKGYSYWLYDDQIDNQKRVPRLLETEAQAKKVIVEWAKGTIKWRNDPDDDFLAPPRRVVENPGRSKDDLEVVVIHIDELENKMISEVDLRDWVYVDTDKSREVLEDLDDFARAANIIPTGQYEYFKNLIDQIELFQKKQIKQIPKLFQPINGRKKHSDGCCHKTVIERCEDCSYRNKGS